MSGFAAPALSDVEWNGWAARFPQQPDRNRYDLAWTSDRLRDLMTIMPSPNRLSPRDLGELNASVMNWREEFRAAQEDEPPVVDPLAVVGVVSLLIGVAAASLVPALTIGTFVASCGLLGHAIVENHGMRARRRIVREIDAMLRETMRRIRG